LGVAEARRGRDIGAGDVHGLQIRARIHRAGQEVKVRRYEPLTIQRTASRIKAGDDPWLCIREFLDDFYAAEGNPEQQRALLAGRPDLTGNQRFDAYLAALAEHLAVHGDLPVPAWVHEPERFLETWWFPTGFRSLHALALVQSPASFRRRGIFVDETELQRC